MWGWDSFSASQYPQWSQQGPAGQLRHCWDLKPCPDERKFLGLLEVTGITIPFTVTPRNMVFLCCPSQATTPEASFYLSMWGDGMCTLCLLDQKVSFHIHDWTQQMLLCFSLCFFLFGLWGFFVSNLVPPTLCSKCQLSHLSILVTSL